MSSLFTKSKLPIFLSIALLIITICVIGTTSWILYARTERILDINSRDRLLAIVNTAATTFDQEDIDELKTEEDWKKPQWIKVVHQMERMRLNNPKIRFVYMFRKSLSSPNSLEFVADSHSLNPYMKIDLNKDGVIDDADQLQWPGQAYEEPPVEASEAFFGPITSKEIYRDQWGEFLTGYSPIKNSDGQVVAVLAVDIEARDFSIITSSTFQPFLIFILLLSIIVTILLCIIIFTWLRNAGFLLEANRIIESQKKTLEELIKAKDEAMHIVNHQVNTPLSIIKSAVAMYRDKLWDEAKFIDTVNSQVKRLGDTVAEFLLAKKVGAGDKNLNLADVDLVILVEKLIEEKKLLKKVREQKMQISFEKYTDIINLKLDVGKMTEVISNLLDNAVAYSEKDILIKLEQVSDTKFLQSKECINCKVLLSVKDSGIGIKKENIEKLFSRFVRLDNAKNTRPDGTGLGLYVCKQIVEAHGGRIWVESDGEGMGSTFKILI